MADTPSKPAEASQSPQKGPKYETWELPADGPQMAQEVEVWRDAIDRGLDVIGSPEVYDGTKTLRRWRVQVR